MSHTPDTGPAPSTPLPADTDPLIGLGDWIGTMLRWQPASSAGQLVVTVAPDSAVLDVRKTDALILYRRIEQQLTEARDLQIALSTSLDSAPTPSVDQAAPKAFASYVNAMAAYLSDIGSLPSAVTLTYRASKLSPAVPPIRTTVTVTLSRQVSANATTKDPRIEQVATVALADLVDGLASFARRFRQTFPTLRLAVDGRQVDPQMLWALDAPLIQPTIAGSPTLFALAPIATRPQSGVASVPDFGDLSRGSGWPANNLSFASVDCDQLFAHFCRVTDELNAPPFASAALRIEPAGAHAIATARSRLAKAYSDKQVMGVLEPSSPADSNNLLAARAAYYDALDDSLANAYAIDAMVAFETTWSKLSGSWSAHGLSLQGAVRTIEGNRSALIGPARVRITGASDPTGTFCYPFRPRGRPAHAKVALPPYEFLVTHVGLADSPGRTPTWLALIEPEIVPIGTGDRVVVPVVNRFQPRALALARHSAAPTAPENPTFSQLFQWDYSADIELQPVAQDVTNIAIHHHTRSDSPPRMAAATTEPSLAAALFRFQAGFVPLAPMLEDVIAGKASAANIVRAIANLVTAVQIGFGNGLSGDSTDPARNDNGASFRLAVSLSPDPDASGKWQLTVATPDAALPKTLSVVPMTLEQTPQPNLAIVRSDPLVISYEPQDPTAAVLLRISLRSLDLRIAENSWAEAQVVRNLALRLPSATAGRYVLATPWSGFSQPVTPSIDVPGEGYDIASIGTPPSSGRLSDWLQMLFGLVFATGPTRRSKVAVAYEYSLSTGPDVRRREFPPVRVPVLTTGLALVGLDDGAKEPAVFASELAQFITAWIAAASPSRANGCFVFDLTLVSAEPGEDRVILHVPDLRLAVADIKELG